MHRGEAQNYVDNGGRNTIRKIQMKRATGDKSGKKAASGRAGRLVNINLRCVPEGLRRELKALAAKCGMGLEAYCVEMLVYVVDRATPVRAPGEVASGGKAIEVQIAPELAEHLAAGHHKRHHGRKNEAGKDSGDKAAGADQEGDQARWLQSRREGGDSSGEARTSDLFGAASQIASQAATGEPEHDDLRDTEAVSAANCRDAIGQMAETIDSALRKNPDLLEPINLTAVCIHSKPITEECPECIERWGNKAAFLGQLCAECGRKRAYHLFFDDCWWCNAEKTQKFDVDVMATLKAGGEKAFQDTLADIKKAQTSGLSGTPVNMEPFRPSPQVHNCGDELAKNWIGGNRDIDPNNPEDVKAFQERDRQAIEMLNQSHQAHPVVFDANGAAFVVTPKGPGAHDDRTLAAAMASKSHVLSSSSPTPRVVDTAKEATETALRMKKPPAAKKENRKCKFCGAKMERWSATTLRCTACTRNEAI